MTQPRVVVLRRTWPQRLLISLNIAVIASLVAASAGLGYFYVQFGRLPRLSFGEGVLPEATGPAFNVLLVGSDTRAGLEGEDAATKGDTSVVSGQRSDTIMVIRVDPDNRAARVLSIPRDLYVPIAGTNRTSRINSAFSDGPEHLIRTVSEFFGISINHYAQVDFNGFRGVVKAVGGVDVYFEAPARDAFSELDIAEAGCIHLDGDQALAYVRSRHYQYLESGRWRSDPTGDIGRISRQQDFIRRLMRRVVTNLPLNPLRLNDLVNTAIENVTIDDQLSADDIIRLARRFRSLDPDTVEMLQLPVVNANRGGASVLLLKEAEAEPIIARFRDEVPPGPAVPSATTVRVLNGTGVSGEAGRVRQALQVVGFNVAGAGDADRRGHDRTMVRFAPGRQEQALLVRSHLLSGAVLVEDPDLTGVDVVIVTGADLTGVTEQPVDHGAAEVIAASTPTTAPATTTPPPTQAPTADTAPPAGVDPAAAC